MPKYAYIITTGNYSDYRILGVTDDKDLAEGFAEKFGGNIEKWKICDSKEFEPIKDKTRYEVIMAYDGKLLRVIDVPDNDVKTTSQIINWDCKMRLEVCCWANDKKHAVKIANEIRAQTIAEGKWDKWVNAWKV
jgi:hypothetical protein